MSGSVDPNTTQPQRPQATPIRAVTVYCSASDLVADAYREEAQQVATLLAKTGRTLVFGGGRLGLMGEVSRAWRKVGSPTVGIITERLKGLEQLDDNLTESIVVETMRERKRLMEERGDAVVVLPGGIGTLEELFEILVGKLLGEHTMPIVILDSQAQQHAHQSEGEGFYTPLRDLLMHIVDAGFARKGIETLLTFVRTPEQVVEVIEAAERSGAQSVDHLLQRPKDTDDQTAASTNSGGGN